MAFTPEQTEAITKEGNNILVSAGAGSGKTTVLSERVLRKVKEGINVDEILILTFTKKAAESMKNKIREKLIENNLADQVNLIDKAYITTFDSFTSSVLKKYHDRLNLDKNISIIDANSIKLFKEEKLDEIFLEYYENNNTLFNNLIMDFCLKSDREIKPFILSLNDVLDLKYDKVEYLTNYIDYYYSDNYINEKENEFNTIAFNIIDLIKEEVHNLSLAVDSEVMGKINNLLNPLFNATTYKDIVNCLEISLPIFKGEKYTDEAKEIKNKISGLIKKLKTDICILDPETLISNYLSTKDNARIITEILLRLDKEINDFKFKHNTFEFIDISKLAIKLVKENKDIKEELTNSFKEIMIDEYQDTSDLQEEFISEIANKNTYMVGDIKQSIYRFRNANPDIFKQKYLDYSDNINGIKIDLNKNFRSREEDLVDINTIFDRAMDLKYGGADYKASHRMAFGNQSYIEEGKTDQGYNLDIYNYKIDKDSKYTKYLKNEIEAFIIANDIKNKVDNKYQIFNKKKKELRDVKYSDFCIIIDKSSSFDTYKKIFEYFKIPLTVFKNVNVAKADELYIIRNILRLLASRVENLIDNNFKYSFVSLARSYLFRLDDKDIYNIVSNDDYDDTDIIKKIDIIKEELPYLDLRTLMERIKDVFNFDERIITVGNVNVRISTLEYFINLAGDLSSMDYDYHKFIEYLTSIIENDKAKIEIPVSIVDKDSASIMTIHTSKGLEYPVCYFPEMSNKFNMDDLKRKIFFDTEYGIILPSYQNGYQDTFIKLLAKRRYVQEAVSEKIRLFYVALTRVEEKMIILTQFKDKYEVKDKEKYISFMDILEGVKEDIENYITDINLDDININHDYLDMVTSKLDDFDMEKLTVVEYEPTIEEEKEEHFSKTVKELITKEEKSNMTFGTEVHELFEIVDFKNPRLDELDIDDNLKTYVNNLLNQDILKNIKDANILKEYEFYYLDGNETKHGIIDLMLEYSDYVDIIDYKLKNVDDLAYLEQLNGYKKYIEAKTNKSVNIYLYSILNNSLKNLG